METTLENITPEIANTYLSHNITSNRPIRMRDVNKYARDMTNGKWCLTHQGIAFNSNNELIDGQHRLMAIKKSGHTVPMLVSRNVEGGCLSILDGGVSRTMKDRMRFAHPADYILQSPYVHAFICCLNRVKFGAEREIRYSSSEMETYINKYKNICSYVKRMCMKNKVKSSGYYVALVSAMACGVSEEAIKRFDYCFQNQEVDQRLDRRFNEQAAVNLRQWYDSVRLSQNSRSRTKAICEKTEIAIFEFVNGTGVVVGGTVFDVGEASLSTLNGSIM